MPKSDPTPETRPTAPVIVTDAETLRALVAEEVRRALREHAPARAPAASEWMNSEQVAELFGVTQRQVQKMARDKVLPSSFVGRHLRFRRADVEAYLEPAA